MRLDNLSVHGFKSFADKTEFLFQPGLTAFVGPNGCGKSNVVDAVKWVLGEQSVKALRGNEMQDVIFNGTPTRRSTGYAEATLTFTNTKGLLPTDYETVSVTRRLYRSGESEYYLNKQRCRLRDIRDLFMDTGIGMDAYSVIEQGKVDILLTANKQGRRAIFEEAAGISKYKSQKRICLSKLDRVANNLLRLGDIIDEVEKRMRSLKYQAAKARRWKRLDDEKRELGVALALHQYDALVADRDATAREVERLTNDVGGLHAGIERMEAELSELETSVIDADHKIATLESEDVRIASELQAAEAAVRMNEQRITEVDELEEAAKAQIAKTQAALELLRNELEEDTTLVAELERAVADGQAELAERRAAIQTVEQTVRDLRTQIEERRVQAVDLASERAKHNNELSAIGAQREQLVRQDRRLAERAETHRASRATCAEQRGLLAERTQHIADDMASLETQRGDADRQRRELGQTLGQLSDRRNAARTDLAGMQSRSELLQDLEAKSEGVGAGVRHLLDAREGGHPAAAGICGVVADVIEVDVEHAAAIEAALGSHEQLVLTETFEAMTNAIDFLACDRKGKASFLPLDAVDGAAPSAATPDDPGVVGRAADLIRHPERFARPIHHLVGDVLVVRDIDTAKRLASTNGRRARYATLDGQLLNRHGVSVGGAARGAPGVISRRSELRSLDTRRATLEADVAVIDQQRQEAAARSAELEHRARDLGARLATAQSERAEAAAELDQLDATARRLDAEIEATESERAEIVSNIDLLAGRETEVRDAAARLEQSESELKTALTELETSLGGSEASRDQIRTEAARLDVAQAQRVEKADSLRRRLEELGRQIAERSAALDAARQQITTCGRRRTEAHEAILASKRTTGELLERRGRLGADKAQAANRRELVRGEFDTKREERNAASRQAKESDSKLNQLNVHATEIAMRIENLEDRTRNEFDCSLSEQRAAGDSEERDWDEVAAEIESLNQKLRSLGAVNTYAIEELEQLEARAVELRNQREDLQKAQHTLREIIRRINRKSRDMFQTTFDQIRENFQVLFRKLFGGGRADVVLEEEVDILDAGVDVIACPPGKEPSSISLLSGGEKTMTAIALLFAIFRSKPSPFCILDEVDAALDESNIDRFTMLVREFLEDSQFIVITHSRRTMAMADALYGITMQEPGVSTRVAVKFEGDAEMEAAGC